MAFLRRLSAVAWPGAVTAILVLLAVLATLQYRWAGELSGAERARLRASARASADALTREFDREVTRVFVGLLSPDPLRSHGTDAFGERYDAWRRDAAYPHLVAAVFLVQIEGDQIGLARYEPSRRTFEPAAWPSWLLPVRTRAEDLARGLFGPDTSLRRRPEPIIEEVPALLLPVFDPERWLDERRRPRTMLPGAPFDHAGRSRGLALMAVVLDADQIRDHILPALARRHFGQGDGLDYDLEIVRQSDRRLVWRSRPGATAARADVAAGLLDLRFEEVEGAERRVFGGGRAHMEETGRWRLLVSYRAGPLDQVVAAARRRNLAVSFGILLLLGTTVTLVVVSSQRARRLARRQMGFVAAVSHELRTPVAVICSMSENLADGVVAERSQVRAYGAVLRDEGRRLGIMVEQVLEFAGTSAGGIARRDEDVDVAALVDKALEPFEATLRHRGFTVIKDVARSLPRLRGDVFALRRALQNLIENALKYDEGARWLSVRAEGERGREVRITVSDHGVGIAPKDLPHVFDAFFRGARAVEGQVRGFGLGLALVRRVLEEHGGRVTVASTVGTGSSFTLHIPAPSPSPEVSSREPAPSPQGNVASGDEEGMIPAETARH